MIADRPLTIAEIFDRAVTLAIRKWRTAVVIVLVAALPGSINDLVGHATRTASGRSALGSLLSIAGGIVLDFALVALALLFAGHDEPRGALALYGAAFASFWRYVRLMFLSLMLLTGGVFVTGIAGLALTSVAGRVGTMIGVAVVAALLTPVFVVAQFALVVAALEGTGARASLGAAFGRAFGVGQGRRSVLLAYAAALTYFAPSVICGQVFTRLAHLTGIAWLTMLEWPVTYVTGFVFFAAVATVATIDYRNRREGVDLDAALDAARPA